MELSEKLMAITQKNDDVLERLEVINKYLEMLHFVAVLDKEGVESLYVSFMDEGGADILMDNIKRAIKRCLKPVVSIRIITSGLFLFITLSPLLVFPNTIFNCKIFYYG